MAVARTSYMARRDSEAPTADDPLLEFEPAPHVAPRKNSITSDRQRVFVAQLAATGIVADAARHIGASLEALYKLRHKPGAEGFAAAWDAAIERAIGRIEHGAVQRAIEGVERPIVSSGKLLGWYRVHNESLVMFLLRQRRRERYGAELALRLKPGDALYERIRREVLDEEYGDEQAVLDSIDQYIGDMRERRAANDAILAEAPPADPDQSEQESGD